MNRRIQNILTVITIIIALLARMAAVGWFYLIGILSIPFFAFFHLKVHHNSQDYLAQKEPKYYLLILTSHILFLCLFFFQYEAGDSLPLTVLEDVVGMQIPFVNEYGLGKCRLRCQECKAKRRRKTCERMIKSHRIPRFSFLYLVSKKYS